MHFIGNCALPLSHILFNAGMPIYEQTQECIGTPLPETSNHLQVLSSLLDPAADHRALAPRKADFLLVAVSLMHEEACFLQISKAISNACGLSLPSLLVEFLPMHLGDVVSFACDGVILGLESRLSALLELLGGLVDSNRSTIEAIFQAFLYDFGQRLLISDFNAASILHGLRQILAFCLLAPKFATSNAVKVVSIFADLLRLPVRCHEFMLIVQIFERKPDLLALPRVIKVLKCILMGQLDSSVPTIEEIDELSQVPWRIGAELLSRVTSGEFPERLSTLTTEHRDKLIVFLQKLSTDCDEVPMAMKLRLFISLTPGVDEIELSPTCRTERDADALYCFDQLHRIKFSIIQVKRLTEDHGSEVDEHCKNALAYTLQGLVSYLGLCQDSSDVWEAFDSCQVFRIKPFVKTQYRFDVIPESVESPIILHSRTQEDYIWKIFSFLTFNLALDMEHQVFLKHFSALMAIHGRKYMRIFSALVISGLVLTESFSETLIQEFIAASSMPANEVNHVQAYSLIFLCIFRCCLHCMMIFMCSTWLAWTVKWTFQRCA